MANEKTGERSRLIAEILRQSTEQRLLSSQLLKELSNKGVKISKPTLLQELYSLQVQGYVQPVPHRGVQHWQFVDADGPIIQTFELEQIEPEDVLYFGYGSNAAAEMIEAITGHLPKAGNYVELPDFELCIQTWSQIPGPVKQILRKSWRDEEHFMTYAIRKAPGECADGMLWVITPEQRKLIGNLGIPGLGYTPTEVSIKSPSFLAQLAPVQTEYIEDPNRVLIPAEDLASKLLNDDTAEFCGLPIFLNRQ